MAVPLRRVPNQLQLQTLREDWAFVLVGTTAFSFHHPPVHDLVDFSRRFAESSYMHASDFGGRRPRDVVFEMIRRCLELACFRAGLKWCPDRRVIYFPNEGIDSRKLSYTDPDGKEHKTGMTGKRSLFRPGQENEVFRYAISPRFFVSGLWTENSWEVRMRLSVRVTDEAGVPHSGRSVITRRKAAAKSWYNQHWFAKTLAVIQHLGPDGTIVVGAGDRRVEIDATPKSWTCQVSIDSAALERMMAEQKTTRDALHTTEAIIGGNDV